MLHGEVVDTSERPVANARVMVLTGPGSYPDTALLTDGSGQFVLGLPDTGHYELGVQADGYRLATVGVEHNGGTATVRVQLRPLG